MTAQLVKQVKDTLTEKRAMLIAEIADLATSIDECCPDVISVGGFADQASQVEIHEYLINRKRVSEEELIRIEARLSEIASEVDEIHCVVCGKPIEPDRLGILPGTPLDSACAHRLGANNHNHNHR